MSTLYTNSVSGLSAAIVTFPTGLSGSLTGNASAVTHTSGQTTATSYPVGWFNGTSSAAYSCADVTITSSTGTLTATYLTTSSDANKKENIKTIENPLDKVNSLRGVEFDWIDTKTHSIGLIAQEVEKIIPEVVTTDSEGVKSISYGIMIGLLIESIKEQQKQIEDLKRQMTVA